MHACMLSYIIGLLKRKKRKWRRSSGKSIENIGKRFQCSYRAYERILSA